MTSMAAEVEALKGDVATRDAKIGELQKDSGAKLQEELAPRDAKIDHLQKEADSKLKEELASREAKINALQQEAGQAKAAAASLSATVDELTMKVKALESEAAEKTSASSGDMTGEIMCEFFVFLCSHLSQQLFWNPCLRKWKRSRKKWRQKKPKKLWLKRRSKSWRSASRK
jgi:hypothetical protein